MDPLVGTIHKSAALSNISIGYRNRLFIADRVFQHVPVAKQSDYFYKFLKAAWFRNEARPRGPGANAARSGYKVTSDTYSAKEYAMSHPIPIENINNADNAIQPWATGVRFATNAVMLAKEAIVSALCCTAANWTTTDDVAGDWAVGATTNTFISDILGGKETIRKAIGVYPNVLVLDAKTFKDLKMVSGIIDRIKYTGTSGKPADVTTQTLAALFELDEVLIGGAIKSSDEETVAGTEFTAVDLWETNATKGAGFLFYRPPAPAIDEPAAGYVFEWNGGAGQESRQINQDVYRQVRYWWEDAAKQFVVEASENFDAKVTAADAGILFYDTLLT